MSRANVIYLALTVLLLSVGITITFNCLERMRDTVDKAKTEAFEDKLLTKQTTATDANVSMEAEGAWIDYLTASIMINGQSTVSSHIALRCIGREVLRVGSQGMSPDAAVHAPAVLASIKQWYTELSEAVKDDPEVWLAGSWLYGSGTEFYIDPLTEYVFPELQDCKFRFFLRNADIASPDDRQEPTAAEREAAVSGAEFRLFIYLGKRDIFPNGSWGAVRFGWFECAPGTGNLAGGYLAG